ncbi:MAG: hypothetical protein IKX00_03130 [Bacilli bacterium]|nr:hypothetical protein [Bacilli bacterium]
MAKKDKNELKEIKEVNKEENLKDKDFRIKNFKDEIDKYIKERVKEQTKDGINIKEYKEQIDKYAKERVEVETSSQTVKTLKKQLSSKKCASGIKSFIILCLLACIGYGVYYLYKDGYFDEKKNGTKCNCQETKYDVKKDDDNKGETDPKKEETKKEDLTKKYSYLLDNIIFDLNSNYTRDYYNGNLTNEIKEYLAYKLIDKEDIMSDDDSSYFELSDLETAYTTLFNEKLNPTSFKYNNAAYSYLESKEMFVASSKPNPEKIITREIINVEKTDDDEIVITTVEGYVDGDKLYNILTNKKITSYKAGTSLSKYKNKLNVIKYTFTDEHLSKITK